jgi:chromosome partitioning protein
MPVIVVVNQKGGVGKTTVSLGLASAAAHRGVRAAVVDLDPQANATSGLDVWEPDRTIDDVLAGERPGGVAEVLVPAGWDVPLTPDVAPSTPLLAKRESQLATDAIGAQDRLLVALDGLTHELVVIDCPPSLGLLAVNGLFAADAALVVADPSAWGSDGVAEVVRTISRVGARKAGGLPVAGIVVNKLSRTRDSRYWYEQLQETYGDTVLPAVHQRAALAEAAAQSLPVHALGKRPGAAEAAAELDAVLERVMGRSTSIVEAGAQVGAVVDEPAEEPAVGMSAEPRW